MEDIEMLSESINLMERMGLIKPYPLLNEIYENNNNTSAPISINETNAKRMLDRHSESGFAILSASRGRHDFGLSDSFVDKERLNAINKERTQNLMKDVQNAGFSYTISYGGFIENQNTDKEIDVYENSVIVYAEKKGTNESIPKELFDFAIKMCGKYNQQSVLIKMPGNTPKYYTKDGTVDYNFKGKITFNDVMQKYFTDLHKNTRDKIKDGSSPTRFTYVESYIAAKPQCYSENHVRFMKGEIFVD